MPEEIQELLGQASQPQQWPQNAGITRIKDWLGCHREFARIFDESETSEKNFGKLPQNNE
jgi:hypothetical protein